MFPLLVRQKGLEPPTYWFVASHSIQLSYWRILHSQVLKYNSTGILKMQAFFYKNPNYSAESSTARRTML